MKTNHTFFSQYNNVDWTLLSKKKINYRMKYYRMYLVFICFLMSQIDPYIL